MASGGIQETNDLAVMSTTTSKAGQADITELTPQQVVQSSPTAEFGLSFINVMDLAKMWNENKKVRTMYLLAIQIILVSEWVYTFFD